MIPQEIKQKIFALYLGQNIAKYHFYSDDQFHIPNPNSVLDDGREYLLVTPLSLLTEDDAIDVCIMANITKFDGANYNLGKYLMTMYIDSSRCIVKGREWLDIFDFLRSKGYALPAFGYSIRQLVVGNVFKLKTSSDL